MVHPLDPLVIRHTHRLPAPSGPVGQGSVPARQFDVALMSVGFKLSAALLECLSELSEDTVLDTAARTLGTVREMAGDHVQHNVYFVDFPVNVPDTLDFWMRCIAEALADDASRDVALAQLGTGVVDLLTLPTYGNYQHTYAEMLAAHDELIAAVGDRMTVLHLGGASDNEVTALYLALAGSTTPLGEEDLRDLRSLAECCLDSPQPEAIPIRENRAVINVARLQAGRGLLLDTVTDVLRLACVLSDGDVALVEPTRFRSLPRVVRRTLLAGLDTVIASAPAKLADVTAHREAFKRLGERLHPHEYPRWPHAADVFAVARGEKEARSFDSRIEELLGMNDVTGAAQLLTAAPGKLFRSLDRLLRACLTQGERDTVVAAAEQVAPQVSGRVLRSVREHLHNRAGEGFEAVEESFFGFMLRDAEQRGRPFEPRTVRMKSELRGPGRVALPLAFLRGSDGRWRAKWLHLYLQGNPNANRVEDNRVSVATLLRGIVERDYLTVRYLTDLMADRATSTTLWDGTTVPDGPVTYIGLERPDGLHPDSLIVTPENLRALIPS